MKNEWKDRTDYNRRNCEERGVTTPRIVSVETGKVRIAVWRPESTWLFSCRELDWAARVCAAKGTDAASLEAAKAEAVARVREELQARLDSLEGL